MQQDNRSAVVVIGGGPAGLTAAYELQKRSSRHRPLVFEADKIVGGIARTESHNGYRFDIGGHRFFTKVSEVEDMWHEVLGGDFITVPRLSRIYYRDKFYDYPLKLINALVNIGPYESMRILLSYFKWQVRPYRKEENSGAFYGGLEIGGQLQTALAQIGIDQFRQTRFVKRDDAFFDLPNSVFIQVDANDLIAHFGKT